MVELGRDPDAVAQRLYRRLPRRPDSQALLGTAFHEWVQRYFQAEKLFDLDDLPGAVDADRQDRGELEELQAAFAVSAWAARTPLEVEVAVRHGDRGTGRPGAYRRGLRRRGRCGDRGGLEDRGTPVNARRPAAQRCSARHLSTRLGAAAGLPGVVGACRVPLRAVRAHRGARRAARGRRGGRVDDLPAA